VKVKHASATPLLVSLIVTGTLHGQESWKVKDEIPIQPEEAERLLTNFSRANKGHAVYAFVVKTADHAIPLGTSCSSSSSGTINGNVGENGDVHATTDSDRFITASVRHNGIQIRAVGWRYHNGWTNPLLGIAPDR
jgi:hypothetical protein